MSGEREDSGGKGEAPDPVIAERAASSQLDFDIAFFDSILEREPNYVDVLRCQGELLTRKGEHDRALEIDRRLARLRPEDALVHYNLACSLTLAGRRAEAVDAMRRALQNGYDDFEHLEQDPDLDALRDDASFIDLIARHRPVE